MATGELNDVSVAIGELKAASSTRGEQIATLTRQAENTDQKLDEHLGRVRETLHSINSNLQEIKNSLYMGNKRMDSHDIRMSEIGEQVKTFSNRLDKHMEEEEAAFKDIIALHKDLDARVTKTEEVTDDVQAIKRTGKIVASIIGFATVVGTFFATIRSFGHL